MHRVSGLPVEVRDKEEFLEIAKRAIECRVKKSEDYAKVKLRTRKYLYTLKVKLEDLDSLLEKIRSLNVRIVEV